MKTKKMTIRIIREFKWTLSELDGNKLMDFEKYKEINSIAKEYDTIIFNGKNIKKRLNQAIKNQRKHFPKETAIYDTLL